MLPIAPDTLLQQRYRVLNMLGEGRFGRTYLAIDLGRGDAYCAIEELAPFSQFSSAIAQAKTIFKQEATLLYQLQHPQLPRFWTTIEEQGRLLLVSDHIQGKTYRDLLNQRLDLGQTFTEAEVWQFLVELLPVIGYVHSKGTIHRDLCPEHIICRESDQLPVPIEFGIVKEFANKLQVSPGSPRGSIGQTGYTPPEQLQTGAVYPNSDLYALAVTAIVLLTGKEASALFSNGKINWDWRKWTDIDDGFAEILGRMLTPEPTDRYQSASGVEKDLQGLEIASSQQFAPEAQSPRRDKIPNPLQSVTTDAVPDRNKFTVGNRLQSAITNLNVKSIWEKPQVFIPTGILISLLAGFGSWFGVTQLLHRQADPVATTPPKQIDFNNPTIPTGTSLPTPVAEETIQPEMDRSIEKEGKVDANTPVRYKISAIAGENLDIQLIPLTVPTADPTKATGSIDPFAAVNPKATQPKTAPTPLATPIPPQVLMTIISPTGGPIDDKADRVLGWRGQLSTSGDYTIELRPIRGLAGGTFPYKLSVTQLSISPASAPVNISPNPAGANPLGAPLPSSGNTGLNAIPSTPNTTIPNSEFPPITPVPVPIQVPKVTPSESANPTPNRKRNRTTEPTNPRTKRDVDGETTTPRRRRKRVESGDEATTPQRQRRNRQQKSAPESTPESTQTPSNNPDLGENPADTKPKVEEQLPILVPEPKKTTSPDPKTGIDRKDPPPTSENIDTD